MTEQNKEEEKFYTVSEIYIEYNLLDDKHKLNILYDALGLMEEYNGRTKFSCIAMALGYENFSGETNEWTKP